MRDDLGLLLEQGLMIDEHLECISLVGATGGLPTSACVLLEEDVVDAVGTFEQREFVRSVGHC